MSADLKEKRAALEAERDQLLASLASAPEREAKARRESIKDGQLPSGLLQGPLDSVTKQAAKDAARLESVEKNIAALIEVIIETTEVDRRRQIAYRNDEAGHAQARQRELLESMGKHFAALHAVWVAYLESVERFDRWRETEVAPLMSGEEFEAWRDREGRFVAEPVPLDFGTMIERLYEATCDPRGRGIREPDAERVDDNRELPRLLPDLRGSNRSADLSGHVPRTSSSRDVALGFGVKGARSFSALVPRG